MNNTGVHKGPSYLEGLVTAVSDENQHEVEWRGKLQTADGHDKFHLFIMGTCWMMK